MNLGPATCNLQPLSFDLIEIAVRCFLVAVDQAPHKPGIPDEIPVSKLVELPARGHDMCPQYCLEWFAALFAVSLQALGEIDVLQSNQAVIEAADRMEIAPETPEQSC
jgi:hypothetical protein